MIEAYKKVERSDFNKFSILNFQFQRSVIVEGKVEGARWKRQAFCRFQKIRQSEAIHSVNIQYSIFNIQSLTLVAKPVEVNGVENTQDLNTTPRGRSDSKQLKYTIYNIQFQRDGDQGFAAGAGK